MCSGGTASFAVVAETGRWLEAGTPDNRWFAHIREEPQVVFHTGAGAGRHRPRIVEEPGTRERIRARLGRKYRLRDRWVALLFETSRSVAVERVQASP